MFKLKYQSRAITLLQIYENGRRQSKIISEYDQKIPLSKIADHPVAPRRRVT